MTLKEQLQKAIPSLTENDFGRHETDLYVVAYPEVRNWLETNYTFWKNVKTFTGNICPNWNGGGKLCFDIPFAAWEEKYPNSSMQQT